MSLNSSICLTNQPFRPLAKKKNVVLTSRSVRSTFKISASLTNLHGECKIWSIVHSSTYCCIWTKHYLVECADSSQLDKTYNERSVNRGYILWCNGIILPNYTQSMWWHFLFASSLIDFNEWKIDVRIPIVHDWLRYEEIEDEKKIHFHYLYNS